MKPPESENERFTVQYIITINDKRSIEEHASDITFEQTVEVPEDCIPEKHFEDGIIGIVENIRPNENMPNQYITSISYRTDITELSIPQFFNVIFGNISLKNNIKFQILLLQSHSILFLKARIMVLAAYVNCLG